MSQQQRKLLSSSKSEYVSVLRLCMTPTEVTKKKRILATSTAKTVAAAPYYFLASLRSQEGQMKESSDCSWPVLTKFLGKAHETLALWTRCSRAYLLTLSWITKSNLDRKINEIHKIQFHFNLDNSETLGDPETQNETSKLPISWASPEHLLSIS